MDISRSDRSLDAKLGLVSGLVSILLSRVIFPELFQDILEVSVVHSCDQHWLDVRRLPLLQTRVRWPPVVGTSLSCAGHYAGQRPEDAEGGYRRGLKASRV